jgi:hypothetical protein
VKVHLPEKFLSPRKNQVDFTNYLFVIRDFVLNDSCIRNDSFVPNLAEVDFGVDQVAIDVV